VGTGRTPSKHATEYIDILVCRRVFLQQANVIGRQIGQFRRRLETTRLFQGTCRNVFKRLLWPNLSFRCRHFHQVSPFVHRADLDDSRVPLEVL